ncbi:MAG TPA: preprotein translocase subunit YajC [Thermoanaerobaculia bacterium]|nr:preprotein translocase subunit YajC [Thermoanaerobaculia bacterium]
MDSAFFLLAQAQGAPAWEGLVTLVPMIAIFAIFYFLLIWPVRRRQKALQKTVEALKRGDKVVTNGGIYGEVAAVEGPTIHLRIADNVKIRVAKSAIAGLEGEAEPGRTP